MPARLSSAARAVAEGMEKRTQRTLLVCPQQERHRGAGEAGQGHWGSHGSGPTPPAHTGGSRAAGQPQPAAPCQPHTALPCSPADFRLFNPNRALRNALPKSESTQGLGIHSSEDKATVWEPRLGSCSRAEECCPLQRGRGSSCWARSTRPGAGSSPCSR